MKPRRWYSSPEMNPNSSPSTALPFASLIQLAYAARTYCQQGSIIKLRMAEPPQDSRRRNPQTPIPSDVLHRIDAA
ncbi:MAG: hypothetical protein HGA19_08225 [Oscillochloris sp.]|nr:hypothetical protein [Oscillochloris sp.]